MVLSPRLCFAVNWYRAVRLPVMSSGGMTGHPEVSNLRGCQLELVSFLSVAYRTRVTRGRAEKSGCPLLIPSVEARPGAHDLDFFRSRNGVSEKKCQGVHWVHLWSTYSKVWWHSMSNIFLVLEKRVKLEDADPWGLTWVRIREWVGKCEGSPWPRFEQRGRF